MKRTALDAGQKSRDRGSTFAAPRKPIERKSQLERVSSSKSSTGGKGKGRSNKRGSKREAGLWHDAVVQGPCVVCVEFPFTEQERRDFAPEIAKREGHHLIPKRALKREGHDHPLAVWDRRNGICLCVRHHALHELFVLRLPRSLLPAAVFEFAAELGLEAILDREYPVVEQHPLNNAIEEAA